MFLKETLTNSKVPDFHAFNTRATRESGQRTKPKTKFIYTPLIDQTLSDSSTMMTAMIEAEKLTNEAGQAYTVFTADQQLYRVILDIISTNLQRFSNVIPGISGMHWLMNFVGFCRCFNGEQWSSRDDEIWLCWNRKNVDTEKFSNVRAIRFVVVELLCGLVDDMVCHEDLNQFLKEVASKSVLVDHWVNNLIKPVFLMLYIRA